MQNFSGQQGELWSHNRLSLVYFHCNFRKTQFKGFRTSIISALQQLDALIAASMSVKSSGKLKKILEVSLATAAAQFGFVV